MVPPVALFTSKSLSGALVLIPTFWDSVTVKMVRVDEPTLKGATPAGAFNDNSADGVDEPMPTLPPSKIVKISSAPSNTFIISPAPLWYTAKVVEDVEPCTVKSVSDVVVAILTVSEKVKAFAICEPIELNVICPVAETEVVNKLLSSYAKAVCGLAVDCKCKRYCGVDVPIPTFPPRKVAAFPVPC